VTPCHATPKPQLNIALFLLAIAFLVIWSENARTQQMEETIVDGYRPDSFNQDVDYSDRKEDRKAQEKYCDYLLIRKPGQCTTSPGTIRAVVMSDYINSRYPLWSWTASVAPYRGLFKVSFVMAAVDFGAHQDSIAATNVFYNSAADSCLNGGGQDIEAPIHISVSNSMYCLAIAGGIAEGMNTNFNVPEDIALSYTISFPTGFGPMGNNFYEGMGKVLQCSSWYRNWEKKQC